MCTYVYVYIYIVRIDTDICTAINTCRYSYGSGHTFAYRPGICALHTVLESSSSLAEDVLLPEVPDLETLVLTVSEPQVRSPGCKVGLIPMLQVPMEV